MNTTDKKNSTIVTKGNPNYSSTNTGTKIIKNLGFTYKDESSTRKRHYYLAKCGLCNEDYKVRSDAIHNIDTRMCKSCWSKKHGFSIEKTHGNSTSKIYKLWGSIKGRCYTLTNSAYNNYGARGIKMYEPWKNDFMEFKKWFDSTGIKESELGLHGLSIDRKDPHGDYTPDNCRFTTQNVQARNTRRIISSNTSGYRGVSAENVTGKFRAIIRINGVNNSIGTYATKNGAAMAYDKYIKDHNLEHTPNNLPLDKLVKIEGINKIDIKYTNADNQLLAGLYTVLINKSDIPGRLKRWASEHKVDIDYVSGELDKAIAKLHKKDIITNDMPIVVESAIPSITLILHKNVDDGIK